MKRSEWADVWWQQAEHDLQAAEVLRKECFWDTCALMCEQAAEKAVKALWIDMKQTDPPKTHRVDQMLGDLGAADDMVDAGFTLVADYKDSRYPDAMRVLPFQSYLEEDADDRIRKVVGIIAWAKSHWES
ncbi:MAG: HEPN domain-containing protein [Armatimonadetes bacterium]|nr:HEPN domain-containing protein [Armatimonadota bacterium]